MFSPDFINAVFESFGGAFVGLSVIQVYKDKEVRGLSLWHVLFFTLWGYWNIYYYPILGQWWSFYGGVGVMVTNTTWLGLILYYKYIYVKP